MRAVNSPTSQASRLLSWCPREHKTQCINICPQICPQIKPNSLLSLLQQEHRPSLIVLNRQDTAELSLHCPADPARSRGTVLRSRFPFSTTLLAVAETGSFRFRLIHKRSSFVCLSLKISFYFLIFPKLCRHGDLPCHSGSHQFWVILISIGSDSHQRELFNFPPDAKMAVPAVNQAGGQHGEQQDHVDMNDPKILAMVCFVPTLC